MSSTPSTLIGTPEGMALFKMQHELSVATANIPVRGDSTGVQEARKMTMLRRSLDSIATDFARSLRNADAEQKSFMTGGDRERVEMRIRELEPQVKIMIRGQGMPTIAGPPMTGYLGVTSSAVNVSSVINGEVRVGYCDYPVVESVEPGSPAEKAGLLAGDTLLAYNGRDLRESDVNFSQLLVPGQAVRVQYRRAGRVREIPMTVAQRPDSGAAVFITKMTCAAEESRTTCETRTGRTFTFRGSLNGSASTGARGAGGGRGLVGVIAMRMPPDFPLQMVQGFNGAESAQLLEASVLTISEEIAASTGGDAGILVMNVPASSHAAESGLRIGDLITEVNGLPVRDLMTMQKLLFRRGPHAATLQVINKKTGARAVNIHW